MFNLFPQRLAAFLINLALVVGLAVVAGQLLGPAAAAIVALLTFLVIIMSKVSPGLKLMGLRSVRRRWYQAPRIELASGSADSE